MIINDLGLCFFIFDYCDGVLKRFFWLGWRFYFCFWGLLCSLLNLYSCLFTLLAFFLFLWQSKTIFNI